MIDWEWLAEALIASLIGGPAGLVIAYMAGFVHGYAQKHPELRRGRDE